MNENEHARRRRRRRRLFGCVCVHLCFTREMCFYVILTHKHTRSMYNKKIKCSIWKVVLVCVSVCERELESFSHSSPHLSFSLTPGRLPPHSISKNVGYRFDSFAFICIYMNRRSPLNLSLSLKALINNQLS